MRSTVRWWSVLLLASVIGLTACGVVATPPPAPAAVPGIKVTLGGSGAGTTILKQIVTPFQDAQADIALEFLQGSSSGAAKTAVAEGSLDVAILMSTDIAGDQQPGSELLALAEDPIAFAVHPDLAIKSLTSAQLRSIYLGQVTNWRELGGPDAAIVVLARDEEEGTTKVLRKSLFGDAPWAAAAIVLTKAGELNDAVKGTPNSIGFGSFCGFVLSGMGDNVIAVDAVPPSDYADGQYPFPARTLAIMYLSANQAKVQPLVDYVKSEAARSTMAQSGIMPLP